MNKVMFSSSKVDWETPSDFFRALDAEFHFTLDVAADDRNHKCTAYYTEADNGLAKPWNGVVWCNPPYGREVGKWVEKGYQAAQMGGGCHAAACPNGHGVVPQVDLWQGRNPVCAWALEIRWLKECGPVP